MTGSIRLHSKHGLNPTLPVCAFCGQDTGEVALLGAAYRGEAPHRMVLDPRQPCQTCLDAMRGGIAFIEAILAGDAWTPGRWCVVKETAAFIAAIAEPLQSTVRAQRRALVTPADYTVLFGEVANPCAAPTG